MASNSLICLTFLCVILIFCVKFPFFTLFRSSHQLRKLKAPQIAAWSFRETAVFVWVVSSVLSEPPHCFPWNWNPLSLRLCSGLEWRMVSCSMFPQYLMFSHRNMGQAIIKSSENSIWDFFLTRSGLWWWWMNEFLKVFATVLYLWDRS